MQAKDVCPHGTFEWVIPENNRTSEEYVKGSYSRIYCNTQGSVCSFKDYRECSVYEKKAKE